MKKTKKQTEELPTATIDQAHFEKFANGPLLLKCFEVVKDATEFVDEGGTILHADDTYVSFIEAYWALKVLFQRETGLDAKLIAEKRIENLRAALFSGGEPEPIVLGSPKVERQQREQQVALERIERRVEDLSQTTVWDHCPQNCQSLTRIKETMLARHGLSGAVVDYVLKVWPNQPNPAGMVRNGHEEALGSQYLVWSKSHVTAAFHRFVSESTMVTATQATHPYFEGRFRLVQKAQS